ncbi:DNA-ligase [Rhodococcus rhodnii LMG 5362]|uniref:DNA-ligase n=1 Tax=Rhodococcus rhodnii LMG 5362 TaxID=1273125 RepID=R7WL44_9NOCA|nr:DNA-ligase [Rhodococcus rhodnii LMG 5362]
MLDLAREHGLEGVVAKRVDSTYRPGRRSPTWIKTPLRNNTEVT